MHPPLKAPFPYHGGKLTVADVIWDALGDPGVYIEPFCGSSAVLLARPSAPRIETINDAAGMVCNFWRAIQADPAAVARHADIPVHELTLHAIHAWLVARDPLLVERLRTDPDYFDPQIAGRWVAGISMWFGSAWCDEHAVEKQKPRIHGKLWGAGLHRKRPMVAGDRRGNGIHQCRGGTGSPPGQHLADHVDCVGWFQALATRLRHVRVCCGDWRRVCTPVVLNGAGTTGVFLDPPYTHTERDPRLYAVDDDVAPAVAAWAREHGTNPRYRIVLAGYDGEHAMPGWRVIHWKANGGYGNQGTGRGRANAQRECLWLSPHCVETQLMLWEGR